METPSPANVRSRVTYRNLDVALRYEAVSRLMAERWEPGADVLEVGSGSGGITQFLDQRVTGLDVAFDRTAERGMHWLEPVLGSATEMPLPDDSYDFVLSLEMLEHLSAADRERALAEMLRVLRPGGRLIATFPADAPASRLDRWLNDAFRRQRGEDHPWVIEHIREGVPATRDVVALVERLLGGRGSVRVEKHMAAHVFKVVHWMYTLEPIWPITRPLGLYTRPFVRVLFEGLRRWRRGPAYRTILVVDLPPAAAATPGAAARSPASGAPRS